MPVNVNKIIYLTATFVLTFFVMGAGGFGTVLAAASPNDPNKWAVIGVVANAIGAAAVAVMKLMEPPP